MRNVVVLVDSLPPFRMFAEIIRAFSRPSESYHYREFCDVIKQEPSIVARLVGVASSAYFGGQAVHSVENAVMLLGFRQTQAILLSLLASGRFDGSRCKSFSPQRYWMDAMMVAHCSAHVAAADEPDSCASQRVFTIGLLHNIGLLLLVDQLPGVIDEVLPTGKVREALRARFGADHYALGARLLAHWGVPEEIWSAVGKIAENSDVARDARVIALTKALVDHRYHGELLIDSRALALSNDAALLERMDMSHDELAETVKLLVA